MPKTGPYVQVGVTLKTKRAIRLYCAKHDVFEWELVANAISAYLASDAKAAAALRKGRA